MAIASLVLGIVSIVVAVFGFSFQWVGILLGIVGIVLGVLGKKMCIRDSHKAIQYVSLQVFNQMHRKVSTKS